MTNRIIANAAAYCRFATSGMWLARALTVKLHFEPNLDFQLQAIEAVRGREVCRTEFPVTQDT